MELSEEDVGHVVSKIFENIDKTADKILTESVMDLVATFIQHDRSEYDSLRRIIDGFSVDGEVSESQMKSAFVKWTKLLNNNRNLGTPTRNSISKIQLDLTSQDQDDSICYSDCSSQGFQDQRIEDLQNKLAHKEHLIFNLNSEIQNLSQQIQLHEEMYNAINTEKFKIIEKHNKDQSNNISYDDYNELMDAFETLKASKAQLQNKIDTLKSENFSLFKKLSTLDDEKQKILHMLSSTEKDKKKARESLCEAESCIEGLKTECCNLSDKISEQEILIKTLTVAKESLEVELSNMLNKTNNSDCIFRSSEYNSSLYDMPNNLTYNFDRTIGELSVETAALNHFTTSTPRNNASLLQELNGTPDVFINTNNYSVKCFSNYNNNLDVWSVPNNNTYNSRSKFTNDTTLENCSLTISMLENELDAQKNFNANLSRSFSQKIDEIASLKGEIENLNEIITNMQRCLSVSNVYCHSLNNTMKGTKIKTRILLYLIKRNCVWIDKKQAGILKILNQKKVLDFNEYNNPSCKVISNNKCVAVPERVLVANRKCKTYSCCRFTYELLFWLAFILFMLACLHTYNTKYNIIARREKNFYFLPWNWITVNEFISLIFEFQYEGPVPT